MFILRKRIPEVGAQQKPPKIMTLVILWNLVMRHMEKWSDTWHLKSCLFSFVMACQVDLSNNFSMHDKRALLSKGIKVRQAGQKTESREIKRKKKNNLLACRKGKTSFNWTPRRKGSMYVTWPIPLIVQFILFISSNGKWLYIHIRIISYILFLVVVMQHRHEQLEFNQWLLFYLSAFKHVHCLCGCKRWQYLSHILSIAASQAILVRWIQGTVETRTTDTMGILNGLPNSLKKCCKCKL